MSIEIDCEYSFGISNQLHFQYYCFSLLLISREGEKRNKIGVGTHYDLKCASKV